LRHRDEDAVLRARDEDAQHRLRGLAGAVCEEDGLRIGADAVALLDEPGHGLAHEAHALGLGVGAEPVLRLPYHQPGRLHDVRRERSLRGPVEELRVLGERQHLANEGERPLAQGLGIADVAVHDLAPLALQLLGAGHDGTANGVLGLSHGRSDVFDPDDHVWRLLADEEGEPPS
jgi:hypothetical protein